MNWKGKIGRNFLTNKSLAFQYFMLHFLMEFYKIVDARNLVKVERTLTAGVEISTINEALNERFRSPVPRRTRAV